MKSTGVVRKIDELGRIVIPIELRRNLDMNPTDTIEIYKESDSIIIEKHIKSNETTSTVRAIDELGRFVIPIELRKNLDIEEKDPLQIFVDNNKIIFKKHLPGCIFCGEVSNILRYKGKNICKSCKDGIINI